MKQTPAVICIAFALWIVNSAFFFEATALANDKLTLAKDGRPSAVIVLPAKPTPASREGAAILADHLKQISGGTFRTISEDQLKNLSVKADRVNYEGQEMPNLIVVGEGKLAGLLGASSKDLGAGGILIRSYPNALVLLGTDDNTATDRNGTHYAVTWFLEESLGCRFLWPGELGKVVPEQKTIEVDAINHSFSPVLQQRRIRMAGGYGDRKAHGVKRLGFADEDYLRINKEAMKTRSRDGGWAKWHRLGGTLRLASGHSFGYMWENHKGKHPEWFAVQPDGTRDQSRSPDRSRLCVSNIELIEEIARDRIERLNKSDLKSVSIGPNDGGQTSFCRCSECKKLDPPNARKLPGGGVALTDRYVFFWNEIAKRVVKVHPKATLTADAYSIYAAPPVMRTLHPNVAIRFVGIKYNNDEKRKQDRDDWDTWSKAVKKIYFRPNLLLSGRRQGTPIIYVHKMAEDFKYMASHSLIGTDFDSVCHHWATQGLNYYVCARLHWNPDLNVDTLLDDYCRSGFGSGADAVKKYFLAIERLSDQLAAKQLGYTVLFTPTVIGEFRSILDGAAKATRNEPDAHKRVAFIRSGLEYTNTYSTVFHIIREHQANNPEGTRLPKGTKQRIRTALDNNWLVSRDVFENNHLAVNVATVAWGSWAYFGRFGWSNPSPEIRKQGERR